MNSDEKIFHLERVYLEIARIVFVFVNPWIDVFARIMHRSPVHHASYPFDFNISKQTFAIKPFGE
jgi:hypothetical protein